MLVPYFRKYIYIYNLTSYVANEANFQCDENLKRPGDGESVSCRIKGSSLPDNAVAEQLSAILYTLPR